MNGVAPAPRSLACHVSCARSATLAGSSEVPTEPGCSSGKGNSSVGEHPCSKEVVLCLLQDSKKYGLLRHVSLDGIASGSQGLAPSRSLPDHEQRR